MEEIRNQSLVSGRWKSLERVDQAACRLHNRRSATEAGNPAGRAVDTGSILFNDQISGKKICIGLKSLYTWHTFRKADGYEDISITKRSTEQDTGQCVPQHRITYQLNVLVCWCCMNFNYIWYKVYLLMFPFIPYSWGIWRVPSMWQTLKNNK